MSPHDVTISLRNGRGNVFVDGVDIAGNVTHMTVDHRPRGPARVTVELFVPHVDLDGPMDVILGPATRAVLTALGWTPPADVDDT